MEPFLKHLHERFLCQIVFREEVSRLGLSVLVDTRDADDKKRTLKIIGEALIYFEVCKCAVIWENKSSGC